MRSLTPLYPQITQISA